MHLKIAQYLDGSPVIACNRGNSHRSSLTSLSQVNQYWRELTKDRSLKQTVLLTDLAGALLSRDQRTGLTHDEFVEAISQTEAKQRFLSSRENSAARWIIPYWDYYKLDNLSKEEVSNLDRSYLQLCLCLKTIASWVKEEGQGEEADDQDGYENEIFSNLTDIALVKLPYKPKPENLHVELTDSGVSSMNAEYEIIAAVAPILDNINGGRQDKHPPAGKALSHGTYAALPNSWIGNIPRYSVWDALTSDALERISYRLGRAGTLNRPGTINGDAVDMHINIDLDAIKMITSRSGVGHTSFDDFFRSMCEFQVTIMHCTRNGTSRTTFHLAQTVSPEDEAVLQTIIDSAKHGRKHKIFMTHEPFRDAGYIQA